MEEKIKFIGCIHSELKVLEDCPLQEMENAPSATVEIFPDYLNGMKNIQPGDEIILFTWLHQGDRSVLEIKPRKNPDGLMTCVFSTRSPNRPNPIGMHEVSVVSVSGGNKISVSNLEVLDQTPLIDIKPNLNRMDLMSKKK